MLFPVPFVLQGRSVLFLSSMATLTLVKRLHSRWIRHSPFHQSCVRPVYWVKQHPGLGYDTEWSKNDDTEFCNLHPASFQYGVLMPLFPLPQVLLGKCFWSGFLLERCFQLSFVRLLRMPFQSETRAAKESLSTPDWMWIGLLSTAHSGDRKGSCDSVFPLFPHAFLPVLWHVSVRYDAFVDRQSTLGKHDSRGRDGRRSKRTHGHDICRVKFEAKEKDQGSTLLYASTRPVYGRPIWSGIISRDNYKIPCHNFLIILCRIGGLEVSH